MPSVHGARWCASAWRCCAGRTVVLAALCFLASTFIPCSATAEGITGFVDLGYSNVSAETEDVLGNVSRTDSTAISQRYDLMFNRSLAPYLRLYANGLFDKVDSRSVINGTQSESTTTTIQPTLDLTLRSPVYLAGVKFNRRVETSTSNAAPATTNYIDFYQGTPGVEAPGPLPAVRRDAAHTIACVRPGTDFPGCRLRLRRTCRGVYSHGYGVDAIQTVLRRYRKQACRSRDPVAHPCRHGTVFRPFSPGQDHVRDELQCHLQ